MISQKDYSGRPSVLSLALFIGSFLLAIASIYGFPLSQERRFPQPYLGLEIVLPNSKAPSIKLAVSKNGQARTLIRRQRLRINDSKLAGDLTAVDIWANGEPNAVRVRVSVIYNDLSNQEWWKEKKETVIGSFVVREGESKRTAELARFGIEPFEMRAIDARPQVFQPGEGPRIINETKALEVVRLEKSLDSYELWLKNNSNKNVVAFTVSAGNGGFSIVAGIGYGFIGPAIAAGATSDVGPLYGRYVEENGVTIPVVVFEDESFEGDPKLAALFLASGEGVRIQAPHVLRLINQALEADDSELQMSFERLETQLWAISEAIDKQSALDLLKTKYPSFDDRTISSLYEELKGGLYRARNRALSPIGEVKRRIQEVEKGQNPSSAATQTRLLRETLTRIKSDFERIIEPKR